MSERRYGRSGQYTYDEWQGVIAQRRHEDRVSRAMEPEKDALKAELKTQLAAAGVAPEKLNAVLKLIEQDRLQIIQWSRPELRRAVYALKHWYQEALEPITMRQIDRNNEIHVPPPLGAL